MRPVSLVSLVSLVLAACPSAPPEDDDDDAPEPCTAGDAAEATLAPGGVLEHCGARVEALAVGTYTLTVVEHPQPLPFGLELVPQSPAVALDADVDALVTLSLPVVREDRIVRLLRHDGSGWTELEPCITDGDRTGADVAPGFVYAALREDRAYADAKEGLGDGTMARTLDGVTTTFDIDGDLGAAIFDEDASGARVVNLFATAPIDGDPEGDFDTLRIVFAVDASGAAEPIEIATGATGEPGGFFVWLAPVDGTGASIELTASEPRLVGTVEALVHRGDFVATMTTVLDVAAERHRAPPEAFCEFPEG